MEITDRVLENKATPRRAEKMLETLMLFLMGVYLAYCLRGVTMFRLTVPSRLVENLMLLMAVVALARLMLTRPQKPAYYIGLPLTWACLQTYYRIEKTPVLYLAILVMGLQGIDHRKILRVHVAVIGSLLVATVMAGLGGAIENLVYVREDLRSSWGIGYPTDFTTIVFFLTMVTWIAWPGLPDWGMMALGLAPLLLSLFVTGSRNGLFCSALFEGVIAYHWLESSVLSKRKGYGKVRRVVDALLIVAMPLCIAGIYCLIYLYYKNPESLEHVNELLSYRLSLSVEGFQAYRLAPFGVVLHMHSGLGFSVFYQATYTFLDISYVQYLLKYGWITMSMLVATWVWMTCRAIGDGNRRMAMVMAVIAVHCVIEHHFGHYFDNVLLLMPLASLGVESDREAAGQPGKRYLAVGIALAAMALLAVLFLPRLMTWLRTIYGAKAWQGQGMKAIPALCLNMVIVAMAVAAAWALYRLLLDALNHDRIKRLAVAALAACVAMGLGLGVWGNRVISKAAVDNASMVEADAGALSRLADFEVCVDDLPLVYRRQFENVRPTVLGGDDLARYRGATVLMDAGAEHRVLISRGFKYAQISDAHAIYTADPAAAEALTAGGYAVSDYYSRVTWVDMESQANRNKLTADERGVLLDGPEQSLTKGPDADLYKGHYIVEYSLFLPEGASDADGEVCELCVGRKDGDAFANVAVTRDQFDADGRATVAIPFTLRFDTRAVTFQVHAQEGRQLGVASIGYRQVVE